MKYKKMIIFLRGLDTVFFIFKPCLIFSVVWLSGCTHQIAFQDLDYPIQGNKHDQGVVAVIDTSTLDRTVSIRSFTTGLAHRWDARPGEMLKQVADIEFPQMFDKYKQSDSFIVPSWVNETLILVLTIPDYQFKDFHAYFTVRLEAFNKEKSILMEKTYQEEGNSQGGKMVWAGAFGMKSAVRQSSLDAMKKIFKQIRIDLSDLLEGRPLEPYHEEDDNYYSPQDSIDSFDEGEYEYYSPNSQ